MKDLIEQLKTVLPKLGDSQGFAQSLIDGFEKYGSLTPKQQPWVQKLIDRANEEKPEPTKVEVGAFGGVVALFAKTAGKLKFPAIVLTDESGAGDVRLSLAGAQSKNAGHVYVKVNGLYRGKVSPAGAFMPYNCDEQTQGWLSKLLKALGEDPAGVAAAHGKLTGKCCFCNSTLTDPKSTDVGYGPVCAKHYDLPWGSTVPAQPAAKLSDNVEFKETIVAGLKNEGFEVQELPKLEPAEVVEEKAAENEYDKMVEAVAAPLNIKFEAGRACKQLMLELNG